MSTVRDKSNPGPLDRPYDRINRTVTTKVPTIVTPQYAGEKVLAVDDAADTSQLWKAVGLTSSDWVPVVVTAR